MAILDQAHQIVGHFGTQKTLNYVRQWYWWPQMAKEVHQFCLTCNICQCTKVSNLKPPGLLPIPIKPWNSIGMDFVGPFPKSHGYNYHWVGICQMTSMVHLIPVKTMMTVSDLSWIYFQETVRLHGLPSLIVSNSHRMYIVHSPCFRSFIKIMTSGCIV